MLQKNVYNLFGQHNLGSCIKETSSNPYNIPKMYARHHGVSLVTQMVKNLPADTGDVGLIPGQKDPLEKEMATHSSTLAWKTP